MSKLKKTILNKLHEGTVTPEELETNTDELVKSAKNALNIDDTQAKDYVSGFIGEDTVDEVNQEVMDSMIKQYGPEKGKQIYYATANKQDRNPEDFHMENDAVGRGIEAGMNPEVEADKYAEYKALMAKLAAEEGEQEYPVKEEEEGQTNNPVKLKADVEKLMNKLDISSIAPYLAKIDNPVEQAEVIGQFAEKIGVPKNKLSAVVAQLRTVAENDTAKMTKNQLVEAVTGRKVVKTIKVKDIK